MFILVVISDIIRIPPADFNHETSGLIVQLELKYANKILHEVGLVIKVHDILSLGEAFIHPGDGASVLTVKARLVVFKPFIGQVLTGKIKGSTEHGLVVSMHFFDHVFIPKENLPFPSTFDPTTWQWRWTYDAAASDGDADSRAQNCHLWMELDSKIKFMVMDVVFTKTSEKKVILNKDKKDTAPLTEDFVSPMVVVGTLTENSNPLSGLGIPEWWTEATTARTEDIVVDNFDTELSLSVTNTTL
jgi:DNA-directed RNA polymerase III subunit RPC8